MFRWQSITYQQFMQSSFIVAAIFNSQRQKRSDKVWKWTDIHPEHAQQQQSRGASGKQVMSTIVAMSGDNWTFAPGESWETIFGTGER